MNGVAFLLNNAHKLDFGTGLHLHGQSCDSRPWQCQLLMKSQWPDNRDTITWIMISNSLHIDFIYGDIQGRSCKKYPSHPIESNGNSNHNKINHNITVCLFYGIYCTSAQHCGSPIAKVLELPLSQIDGMAQDFRNSSSIPMEWSQFCATQVISKCKTMVIPLLTYCSNQSRMLSHRSSLIVCATSTEQSGCLWLQHVHKENIIVG